MERNAFNDFLGIIREEAEKVYFSPILTGIVKSELPNIEIETNGIVIDQDNLEIDKWLLDRHNSLITKSSQEHTHESESYKDKLNIGDKVVLLRQGDLFLILSKVVKLHNE
ncbi:DUF2577 family protein [Romboutsia sp. 1001285H_161024_C4]|uniref:DUF2577 family protein n=1 Tax=Romboutsia sp. 1001285H_161024_C4 TaxID=2787109 RepID=UPI0018997D7B|nr:DUF2577 family protein [Romboutsia sp. 1001285H_161024_C4]